MSNGPMEAISPFVLRAIACDMEEMQSPQAWADRCRAAAAEIEKLRAALRRIIDQSTETFCINPEGGTNIVVEGHDRFAFEADVKALLNIARAALGEKEAVG